jgi:hypothetical protein
VKKIITLLFLSFLSIFNGCSKKEAPSSMYDASSVYDDIAVMQESPARSKKFIETEYEENIQLSTMEINKKLITTANLRIRIEKLDTGAEKITELMEKYNSYSVSTRIYENSREYTLKIPAEKYKSFLEELMAIGKVMDYSEKTEDVTIKYYDLESRLNTKRELMKTYQNYLEKAKNIEEILSVEAKIAELQMEIDATGNEFRVLSNLVDYSTIQLELLGPITVSNYGKKTIGEQIKSLLAGLGDYASIVLIIFLGIIVYGLPTIIMLILLYWVLFGKIGLLKKVWRFVADKKEKGN